MGLLTGKTALVTGAARGIGKAVAMKFAEQGADIAFTDLELSETVLATKAELEQFGVRVNAYASNAADFEQSHQVVAQIVKDFGRIDVLVNNAGITKDNLLLRMSVEDFEKVININLKGTFNVTKNVVPYMMKKRNGKIEKLISIF